MGSSQTLWAIVRDQVDALEKLPPEGVAAIQHEVQTLKHLHTAIKLAPLEQEPFYGIYAREGIGAIYHALSPQNPSYLDRAIEVYVEVEQLARQVGDGLDCTMGAYNLGWAYAERGDLEIALHHFKRGYLEAIHSWTDYEKAIFSYGMGFVFMQMGMDDEAVEMLTRALSFFVDESRLMTTACLTVLAALYTRRGDLDRVIEKATDALDNVRKVNHPVQLHHALSYLTRAYFHKRHWKTLLYLVKMYQVRLRYRMTLWPPF
jgi:tetratricopeptide (TPR) repeat protein